MLPDTDPEKSLPTPFVPIEKTGLPEIIMSPPEVVPALVFIAALRVIADVVALVVAIPCETVRFPVLVPILITPLAEIPFVVSTVPTINAVLSKKVRPLTALAAKVPMALLVLLSRVTLPPKSNKLEALTDPLEPSVTLPEPFRVIVFVPEAVNPALIVIAPP